MRKGVRSLVSGGVLLVLVASTGSCVPEGDEDEMTSGANGVDVEIFEQLIAIHDVL